jgi:SAM-dependent methyltransferase
MDLVTEAWGSEKRLDIEAVCQWTSIAAVQANLARRASGDPRVDWVDHSLTYVRALGRPARAVSLGCGFGVLERRLWPTGLFREIVGVDIAPGAVEGAGRLAAAEGCTGLRYEVGDLNSVELPDEAYDVVYALASLHHVSNLEHVLAQVKRTLKPDGVFVVYDYTGPHLMQHSREHLLVADDLLMSLPERYRRNLRMGGLQRACYRLSLQQMVESDPSEGVRAHEIPALVAQRFRIQYSRALGGTLQFLIFSDIAGNFKPDDAEAQAHLKRIISIDNSLIDAEVLPSYHTYIVARQTTNPVVLQTENASVSSVARLSARTLSDEQVLLDWHTAGQPGTVSVSIDGANEVQLTDGVSGYRLVSIRDDEIAPRTRPLRTRPFLVAEPNPVPIGQTTTRLTWEADEPVDLFASVDGGEPGLVAYGGNASMEIDWIQRDQSYVFTLRSHETGDLFDTCEVYQGAMAPLTMRRGTEYVFTLRNEQCDVLQTATWRPASPVEDA